ncbi:alpha/beta fold hydrolase [Methylocapsa sp. S129]|uniref:alpha/beta fold hydrolase n=1 Tax=Methylocapsa sp. S129 TaxID=1641869 RepID=UPI00131AD316|nr:alpha/beta hydrolase [Methylocapsa sp. S129]
MHLVSTPDNPIPPGASVAMARAVDGVQLRTARWVPQTAVRGTVAILQGRSEFIEKYFELIGQLLARGFAVATMDWRGQGGSTRQLKNPRKGHIDDFSLFERDLGALVDDVLGPSCPQPWFGLCHSMGGAIMLSIAHAGRSPFERVVLTAPMIGPAGLTYPRVAHTLVEILDTLGFGGAFAPGGRGASVMTMPFKNNVLTSDPVRYARSASVLAAAPELGLGWWTIGWAHAAFRLWRRFEDPDYARQILGPPMLIVGSSADRVVDLHAIERFASRLRSGRLIMIDGAEHEILVERDALRDQFWAAFDKFIPGVEGERAARR